MSLQSPLNRVLGLGSAKEGTGHWWGQRLTAVAIGPLILWLLISLAGMGDFSQAAVQAWVGGALNSVLLILLILSLCHHSQLGVQVVIEDYVHGPLKVVSLVLIKFAHVAVAVAGVFAVIRISVGAGS